jgi:Zn-dependent M28 family amino/carboxypeptidase
MARAGRSLRQRQEALNQALLSQSTATEVTAHLQWDSTQEPGRLANVLGLMPAARADKPSERPETVIVGAHRDHFGRQAGLLFPGADDNASGTAVMLEAVRLLSQSGMKSRREILFISFSGEEQGLLGSRLYVSRSSRPRQQTIAMLNIDHAGAGNGRLTVGVTDLPKTFTTAAAAFAGLSEKVDLFGFFPGGDHVPFKEAGIPTVTIVSGGAHPHFHRPTDRAQTVNPEILETAAKYLLTLTWQLANKP